jgi:hypothetical protein
MNKLILISLLVFSSTFLQGRNYYFSESLGNDAWSGTLPFPNMSRTDGPKKSLNALNTLLNSVARPGDSLLLKRGDVWTGTGGIASTSAQGVSGNHIVVGAYDRGPKPRIIKSGQGEILLCRGSANASSSYLTFQNLSLSTNSALGSRPVGVFINESFYSLKPHHITLDSLYISNCLSGMILYQNNILVEHCFLEKNGNMNTGHGIFSSANDIIFRKNVLDSNGIGSFFVHSVYISQATNVIFEGNEIRNADDGLKLRASTNLLIKNNLIHDMYIHTIHVGGDENSGTKNVIIDGNVIYNAPQGITINSESGTQTLKSENIIIRNNILPAHLFISNNGPVKDIFIYNNLIHSASNQNALVTLVAENPINIHLKNNIFYKTTVNSNHALVSAIANSGLSGIVMANNLYYFPVASRNIIRVRNFYYNFLPEFQVAYPGQERFGQQGNPNFVGAPNDFNLSALSILAIDKGENLTGLVDTDLEGRARPIDGDGIQGAAWDIGPYEFCCITDVQTLQPKEQSYIYPNPIHNVFEIRSSYPGLKRFDIIDLSGKIKLECIPESDFESYRIDKLEAGFYVLRMYYDTKTVCQSFLKL